MTAPRTADPPAFRVARAPRRRGAFGLDERRFPDPARVEAELRGFLAGHLPEVWPVPASPASPAAQDRTLTLLLPRGYAAVLRIARDPARPDPEAVALADRCRAMGIPHATVSSLAEGRAALRRLGVEPRPAAPTHGLAARQPAGPTLETVFGGT